MGNRRMPGLYKRGEIWHIDKQIKGYGTLRESCKTGDLQEAERQLTRRLEEIRQAQVYGVRPNRTFREAATKYLEETEKRSLDRDALDLRTVDPFIGDLPLRQVHSGTLQAFIKARRTGGVKSSTVNRTLAIVRRVLNLAARLWRDENGLTWLETPPLIQMVDWNDQRQPYPLSWEEQDLLFKYLPPHLAKMALFKVNTGIRATELSALRWAWEEKIMDTSVFVVPSSFTKNKEDRLVVLNSTALSVIEGQRGKDAKLVFPYRGRSVVQMSNNGWQAARKKAAEKYEEELEESCPDAFRSVRVHDLKHTFGRRLRAAGVPLETRKVLLGHKSGDITTHYSAAELSEVLNAAELVCNRASSQGLVLLKGGLREKVPQGYARWGLTCRKSLKGMPERRLELRTYALRMRCSTN